MNFAEKFLALLIVIGSGLFYFSRKILLGRAEKAEHLAAKEKIDAIETKAELEAKSRTAGDILRDFEKRYGPNSDGGSDGRG